VGAGAMQIDQVLLLRLVELRHCSDIGRSSRCGSA
jgi:hypothetical protein